MSRVRIDRRFCLLLTLLLALYPALGAIQSARAAGNAARAGAPTITTFYSTTKAAYDAWNGASSPAPAATSSFPSGTRVIAFYFEYQGTTSGKSTFQIVLRDHTGANIGTGSVHTFTDNGGSEMLSEDYGGAYPNGSLSADLLINKVKAASAGFSVGVVTRAVTITQAYLITKQAYDAWDPNSNQNPPASTAFSSSAQEIGIFFSYTHAKPSSDTFQFTLSTAQGKRIGTGKVHPFPYDAGSEGLILPLSDGVQLTTGSYSAALVIDGAARVKLPWTVGGGTPLPTPQPVQPTGPPVTVTHCNAKNLEQVVKCDEPSVLRVHVQLSDGEAEGTAFVVQVDSSGTYLVTNRHVVEGGRASGTTLFLPDGHTSFQALAILVNNAKPGTAGDLAVIRIEHTALHPLAWGDSSQLAAGQTVASIGYGLAFQLAGPPSVTEGVVSAVGRDLGDGFGPVWIQHQSTINHGNSGGPLVNLAGDVMGVNTLGIDQLPGQGSGGPEPVQGIFFAIPANMARTVATQLIGQMEHTGTVRTGGPPQQIGATPFKGSHYTVSVPSGWAINHLDAKNPLFVSSDQLIQITITVEALKGQNTSVLDLVNLAKNAASGFGTVTSTSFVPASVGNLQGVRLTAKFSDVKGSLDLFMLADPASGRLFVVARIVDPAATPGDVRQANDLVNSLREQS